MSYENRELASCKLIKQISLGKVKQAGVKKKRSFPLLCEL